MKAQFEINSRSLEARFKKRLADERAALSQGTLVSLRGYLSTSKHVGNTLSLDKERNALHEARTALPYRLCTITFADGYFGLRQAIDIDSARYALDSGLATGVIDHDTFRWLLIALCQAANRIATTTGHFAQFLKVKSNNLRAYTAQRRRSFWENWVQCASGLRPIGLRHWRRRNRAFNCESLGLLSMLQVGSLRPSIVYADPPYTDDQYSRYYHVWETLVKYDYPAANGEGRYRPDRFQTPFSRIDDVGWAFKELIRRSAALDADLVLSYPKQGLLYHAGHDVVALLRRFYSRVALPAEMPHKHSTMGASKGRATNSVTEQIYFASNA